MAGYIPYMMQGKNLVLVIDNKSHTISKDTHPEFAKVVEAIKAEDWDAVEKLVDFKKSLEDFGAGKVQILKGEVHYDGELMHNALSKRLIDLYREGFPITPMVNFLNNLMENPSKRAVDELFGFLEKNTLPITSDGYFLAYKKVRENYMDIHSGTFSNKVGDKPTMRRNQVNEDARNTCSEGLHFCSESYLKHFGSSGSRDTDRVMIVKVNPRDVVSIPVDYNSAKGRCCEYEVVAEYGVANETVATELATGVNDSAAPAAAPTTDNFGS
jgi:hypothetical protein